MKDITELRNDEWLEADGLGGFASGTVSGIRARRYHALLLTATRPPTGRLVLVNGFDAAVETASGSSALSSQHYPPEILHPDGAKRVNAFSSEPWPQWTFVLDDGTKIEQEIFVVGGLPLALLDGERAKRIVDAVEKRLWTPLGLRSLAPDEADYVPHYHGGVRERDGAYHQGTVWSWLIGPFVEAWLRVNGGDEAAKRTARARFVAPLLEHLQHAGLGHVSEIADAEAPHTPRGCPFQAWSLAELLRLDRIVLTAKETRKSSRQIVPGEHLNEHP